MPNTGKQENAIWPMPKFYFKVMWGKHTISFSEITGLNSEATVIEYRHGDSKIFSPQKMPGMKKVGNVTMKRGVFVGDNTFWEWYEQIQLNTIEDGRQTIVIQLLNEKDQPTMVWTLNNAWPMKITSTDMKSDANDPAIDMIEIAYETLSIKNNNNP